MGGKSGHQQAPRLAILRAKLRLECGDIYEIESATENKPPQRVEVRVKR